jgi:trehalose 6-phosphate phosphatase
VSVSFAAAACAPLLAHPADAALFLDLDGTLAPIVAHPRDAQLIEGAVAPIVALRDALGLVGFVSGRGIGDLRRIVDIPGCAYAGNHGFELQLPGGPVRTAEAAQPWREPIDRFAAAWEGGRLEDPGVHIEHKGATLSVHWRTARDPEAAAAIMHEQLAPAARADGLAVTWGRMVMEVRPPVAINKGTAVAELLADGSWRHAAYVGDDHTDADAWRTLHAMRDAGALATAAAVLALSPETPPELREAADAEVIGPPGVLELLTTLRDRLARTG